MLDSYSTDVLPDADATTRRNNLIGSTIGGLISLACFGYGVRAAWLQARPMKTNEIGRVQILSGMGFATRALSIATILTCSGYGLLVFGVSLALDVQTPREFGQKMKQVFGNRYRIKGSENTGIEFEEIFKNS